ncbi:hypothetical protein AAY473_034368 [Plecturocebus cupreus]
MESRSATQDGVQWYDLGSLQPCTLRFQVQVILMPASASKVAETTDGNHHALLILIFLVDAGFPHVDQSGHELPTSGDPPALASQKRESPYVAKADLKLLSSGNHPVSASQTWTLDPGSWLPLLEESSRQPYPNDEYSSSKQAFANREISVDLEQFSWLNLSSSWASTHAPLQQANLYTFSRDGLSHVGQAGDKLLTSSDQPTWASQSAEIIGVNHPTEP